MSLSNAAEKEIAAMCNKYPDAYPGLLREAMAWAYRDAAERCAQYAMDICEDEGNGGASHYAACISLRDQLIGMQS